MVIGGMLLFIAAQSAGSGAGLRSCGGVWFAGRPGFVWSNKE
uniref:Uncharacterized protein n=1 Tax=Curvibacter symbiont subsp. Hydra magnipapillata TaxID=667019 RepID=C9YDH9_CURXX|nr:hypothetical protein Csp_C27580 [Curvibacter putative symbiont of Hydra magnipapillata]